ncbi:MAG: tail fiber domain-containing protein [Clostridia bacterium]
MSNIGYREIFDLDALSLKLLNDNLRALWGKVMGDIALRDLGSDTTALIDSKADTKALDAYATITQTTDMIGTKVGAVDGRVTAVEQTADGLTARVATAEGNISTVQQTANGLTSRVSSVEGSVSQVQQGVDRIDATVSGAGGLASQVSVLSDRVAIKVCDPSISPDFETNIGTSLSPFSSVAMPGLTFKYGGSNRGGFYVDANRTMIGSENRLEIKSSAGIVFFGAHETGGSYGMVCDLNILPRIGGACDLGGNGNGMRWNKLYANNAVNVSSDLRLKTDVAPLDMAELLGRLRPIRYRMIADGENGKVRWGFGAQHVREALGALGVQGVEFLDQENPEHLALCYTELIAVLVEGWQAHEAQIAELKRRLERLEETTC